MNNEMYREVKIFQAENGYIVWSGMGAKEQHIFTDLDEALRHVKKFFS